MKKTLNIAKHMLGLCLLVWCLMSTESVSAQTELTFSTAKRGPVIGDLHYGIFYEEINHAGDGGIYAELVRNGSMEENGNNPDHWWTVGSASFSIATDGLLNSAQTRAMRLSVNASNGGTRNIGYWGMKFVKGETYKASLWVRTEDAAWIGSMHLTLESESGESLGRTTVKVENAGEWTKYTAEIVATKSDQKGWFSVRFSKKGTFYLDCISLFPPTYKGRENGMRPDLAEKLEALKPKFMRFPGGCYVEGGNRYQWKHTVGPVEERRGIYNSHWGYPVSNGMGFHEFLQLSEDLGAEPLFVVNVGMGHGWFENYQHIEGFIEEALDAIEYCNGSVDTYWGKKRAEAGHPEPFNLRLMEIGNENYNYTANGNNDQSDHYAERYKQFYDAIHARYPYIIFVGNTDWGSDYPTWRNPYPVDLLDEHFYRNPDWFAGMYHKYDNYSRTSQGIYCGEYAVTSDYGNTGTLKAALGEAIFMAGMEVNSDVVRMASYAPIFVNENAVNWSPDMIRYNCSQSFGTPSYWAQQMMSSVVGHQNITWTETNNTITPVYNHFGVGSWNTAATYTNIKVTDVEGKVVYENAGPLSTNASAQGTTNVFTDVELGDCTIELDAVKNSGDEGFLITFAYANSNNYAWWNIGGWANGQHGIEQAIGGSKQTLATRSGNIATGQTYHIKVVRSGSNVKCYLDDALMHNVMLKSGDSQALYACASLNAAEDTAIVKVINYNDAAVPTVFRFSDATIGGDVALHQMSNTNNYAENTMGNPNRVRPKESVLTFDASTPDRISIEVPGYSLTVMQIPLSAAAAEQPAETASLPAATYYYNFEQSKPEEVNHQIAATLQGDAAVKQFADGHALFTGADGQSGYLDLGNEAALKIGEVLNSNQWSVSLNLLIADGGNFGSYCWAWALANGTSEYYGMVNQPNNLNWYFEKVKNGTSKVATNSGFSHNEWHNITVSSDATTTKVYVDGQLRGSGNANVNALSLLSSTTAWLGHSPFAGDKEMTGVYFDDFAIYGEALTAAQALTAYQDAAAKSTEAVKEEKEPAEADEKVVELIGDGKDVDITSLLVNPDFSKGNEGWEGTILTAAPGTVAEQFYKVFDTFQILENMPAGTYRMEWQGFYRDGDIANAYNRYNTGKVEHPGEAYAAVGHDGANTYVWNDVMVREMRSIYEEEGYTYDPYTYPDNVTQANQAFTDGRYQTVSKNFVLTEVSDLRIGFRQKLISANAWNCFDNVKLYYVSDATDATAIQTIMDKSSGNDLYYDLQGRVVSHPSRGIYIHKGKKVWIKSLSPRIPPFGRDSFVNLKV